MPAQARVAASQGSPSRAFDELVYRFEREFTRVAGRMPADRFDFTPMSLHVPGADFTRVMSFADQVKHVTQANYANAANVAGSPKPVEAAAIGKLKAKDEILAALAASFLAVHQAIATITVANQHDAIDDDGVAPGQTRESEAAWVAVHGYDHYGHLVEYLETEPDLEIVGECQDGDEAMEFLRSTPADLLFLDIQMPGLTGLEVARELGANQLPHTIFLTAFRESAVEAFEVEAVDYLTKPVEPSRLRQALQRVRQASEAEDALSGQRNVAAALARLELRAPEARAYASRLIVPDGPKDVLLPVQDIEWIEASDYYSSLHVRQRTYLLRESLSDLEQRLNPELFLRVHRSALVNLNFVGEFHAFQTIGREQHAPASEVLHGRRTDDLAKAQREHRARHADACGQDHLTDDADV